MGRLGWAPSEFWKATLHDLCAAFSGTPEEMAAWGEREEARMLRRYLETADW